LKNIFSFNPIKLIFPYSCS